MLHGQPTMLINNLGLNEGHGGVATAHAEGADLHEAPKKLPINHPTHNSVTFLRVFFISQQEEADNGVHNNRIHQIHMEEIIGHEGAHNNRQGQGQLFLPFFF